MRREKRKRQPLGANAAADDGAPHEPPLLSATDLEAELKARRQRWSGVPERSLIASLREIKEAPDRFTGIAEPTGFVTRAAYIFDSATGEFLRLPSRGVTGFNAISAAGFQWLMADPGALDWVDARWSGRVIRNNGVVVNE